MSTDNAREGKIRAVARLLYARNAFATVADVCTFVASDKNSFPSTCYPVVMAGVTGTYARPFLEGTGLGALPSKYATFDNHPDHQQSHTELIESRHSIYVHFSPDEAERLFDPDSEPKEPCQIEIQNDRVVRGLVVLTGIKKDRLEAYARLCIFQRNRMMDDLKKALEHLKGAAAYADGVYTLGVDFPKPEV